MKKYHGGVAEYRASEGPWVCGHSKSLLWLIHDSGVDEIKDRLLNRVFDPFPTRSTWHVEILDPSHFCVQGHDSGVDEINQWIWE